MERKGDKWSHILLFWSWPLLVVFMMGCSSLSAPHRDESELIKWIEYTHEVCKAIMEEPDEKEKAE